MSKILIPHGTSPTGFGIRQRSNGNLRAISKCCGRSMEYNKRGTSDWYVRCKSCNTDYAKEESTILFSLGNDIVVTGEYAARTALPIAQEWVRAVTSYTDAKLDVKW